MPNNFLIDIINPDNPSGAKETAIIPHWLILNYFKYAPVRYENLRAAKHVLENTKRIFAGVRRFNDGGWCFTGRPDMWYVKENVRVTFPKELVFAVYLNPRLYVYEARAEQVATDDEFSPCEWRDRYSALIWKSIS
jgi:hypothetical protein